jgi:hypothetical protein
MGEARRHNLTKPNKDHREARKDIAKVFGKPAFGTYKNEDRYGGKKKREIVGETGPSADNKRANAEKPKR